MRINLIIVISILLFLFGCSSFNSMSDTELIKIAKNFYNYYYSSKSVKMVVLERGRHDKECSCFPVKFRMFRHKEPNLDKTLYFYKTDSGDFDVREFKNGLKFVTN